MFTAFVLTFIFINYKWGYVATPVLQYGMFGGRFYMKDTQTVYKIYTDDQLLDVTRFSFEERDMLFVSLEKYSKQAEVNRSIFAVMQRIPGINNSTRYSNTISDKDFTKWYSGLLRKITGKPFSKLEVYQQQVLWQQDKLNEIAPPEKLAFIVTD
ncbi:hypothetical protein [Ferruginibacter sp.]